MQKSSVNQKSKMFKLSISPTFRKTKYFVFRNKKYPFDYDIFNKNSYFFVENKNQYENVEYIDLFNEKESEVFQNITDKAITDFISLMQNKECQIDISDIHYIQCLSQKFKAETLSQDISNMISIHAKELALDHLLFKLEINKQNNLSASIRKIHLHLEVTKIYHPPGTHGRITVYRHMLYGRVFQLSASAWLPCSVRKG